MQAITTKFHGPGNVRGARVTARAQAGRVTVGWDHALDVDANHDRAALALIAKYGWGGVWHRGALPDGTGNVYVCASRWIEEYGADPKSARIFDPYAEQGYSTRGPWTYESGAVYAVKEGKKVRIALMDREEPGTGGAERDANARLIASLR